MTAPYGCDKLGHVEASVGHTLRRGAFHALSGLACVFALLYLPRLTMLAALGGVTAALLAIELARLYSPSLKQRFSAWFAPLMRRREVDQLTGSSYFLASCLITVLAFPREIAALAILFLSLGDPLAAVVGTWRGRTRFWGKSLEGHLACLAVCLLIALVVSETLGEPPLAVAVSGAVIASIIQALPLAVNDNLTIPIGSAAAMLAAGALA